MQERGEHRPHAYHRIQLEPVAHMDPKCLKAAVVTAKLVEASVDLP